MKKLILMTSALTLMGGAAYADITVTADASVSYGNWGTGAAPATFAFNTGATLALEQTAGDFTYGGEISIDADAGTVSDGVIWVSGGFGKVSFGVDAFDELSEDLDGALDINGATAEEDIGDVKYEGEFGDVSVTIVADAGLGNTPVSSAAWIIMADYDGGAFSLGLESDSTGLTEVSAGYDSGSFSVDVTADSAGAAEVSVDTSFGDYGVGATVDNTGMWEVYASATFGGVNAKVTTDSAGVTGLELDGEAGDVSWALAGDTAGASSASLDYAMGAMSIGVAYDNDDAGTAGVADFGDEADLIVTLGYEVNENLTFELKANDQSEYEASFDASFEF